MPNLVLVELDGADPTNVTNIAGQTDVVILDWHEIRNGDSGLSTEEAYAEIAKLKVALYPWRDRVPKVWADLLETENDWLEGAASDANLTYSS